MPDSGIFKLCYIMLQISKYPKKTILGNAQMLLRNLDSGKASKSGKFG